MNTYNIDRHHFDVIGNAFFQKYEYYNEIKIIHRIYNYELIDDLSEDIIYAYRMREFLIKSLNILVITLPFGYYIDKKSLNSKMFDDAIKLNLQNDKLPIGIFSKHYGNLAAIVTRYNNIHDITRILLPQFVCSYVPFCIIRNNNRRLGKCYMFSGLKRISNININNFNINITPNNIFNLIYKTDNYIFKPFKQCQIQSNIQYKKKIIVDNKYYVENPNFENNWNNLINDYDEDKISNDIISNTLNDVNN